MRIFNKYKTILIFVAGFIMINLVISFVLRPFSSSGREMWEGFFEKEDLNCIYVGSSQCLCDMDPQEMDLVTGLSSYNMGTNMQSIQSSFKCIRTAVERGGISDVVLILDPEIMGLDRKENGRVEACLYRSLSDELSLSKRAVNNLEFITDPNFVSTTHSVTYFIPWTYDRASNPVLNIREKLSGRVLTSEGHRDQNGREPSDQVFESGDHYVRLKEAKDWSAQFDDLIDASARRENLETLEEIAKYCSERGVMLYTVTAPHVGAFTVYDYDSYVGFNGRISELLYRYGYRYCNFNLLKEEFFDTLDTTLYKDDSHLNNKGAAVFSKIVGEYINMEKGSGDISDRFYEFY